MGRGKLLKAIKYSWINAENVINNSIQCVNTTPWSRSFEQITPRKKLDKTAYIYLRTKQKRCTINSFFIFFNESFYFSSIFLKFDKFIKECVTSHTIYRFVNALIQSVNTRSNVIYTTQWPVVIFTLSMAAKCMSLYSITMGKVK